jgi:uncharacterized membrane protein YfcA
MLLEAQILIGVLLTSILSGVIGMGGGLILMGLYTLLLPVQPAMILHGVTQLSSNGFRAYLHREHIQWRILMPYFFGAALVFTVLRYFAFVPSKAVLLIALGSFTFISFIPFIADRLDILKRYRAFVCGVMVTIAQILAGASGGVLDVFYVNSSLDKHKVIGSKAMTQSLGHFTKLAYYLSIAAAGSHLSADLKWWIYPSVALTAFLGTRIGKIILDRLSEQNFRRYSKFLILIIGVLLVWRGLNLLR